MIIPYKIICLNVVREFKPLSQPIKMLLFNDLACFSEMTSLVLRSLKII